MLGCALQWLRAVASQGGGGAQWESVRQKLFSEIGRHDLFQANTKDAEFERKERTVSFL